jgi:hypothetical protein
LDGLSSRLCINSSPAAQLQATVIPGVRRLWLLAMDASILDWRWSAPAAPAESSGFQHQRIIHLMATAAAARSTIVNGERTLPSEADKHRLTSQ